MFLADLPGAIVVPLANANPPPAIGPITQTVLPIGKWKIQTDGIVLLSATDGPLNENVAQIIFPEMSEFVFYTSINLSLSLAMANVGTCRVSFYPENDKIENVEAIRSGVLC